MGARRYRRGSGCGANVRRPTIDQKCPSLLRVDACVGPSVTGSRRRRSQLVFAIATAAGRNGGAPIKTEKLSYRSFQKNFGRSVKLRAPGMLVSTLRRKAEGAGGGVIEIKKLLSQRIHGFCDGAGQRDLYSAFLATCCATDTFDICQVEQTWPAAEPLLRRAMSRLLQPASGKGFARPHIPCVRVGHSSKRDSRSAEAVDIVAQARATERQDTGTLRTP
jgi:putative transposase